MKVKANVTISSVWKNFINIKHGLREIDSLYALVKENDFIYSLLTEYFTSGHIMWQLSHAKQFCDIS